MSALGDYPVSFTRYCKEDILNKAHTDTVYMFPIFAFLRAEGGKNIHFPARGSASEALAAFYQKICLNTEQLTMEFG